jgi:hypothetical protein
MRRDPVDALGCVPRTSHGDLVLFDSIVTDFGALCQLLIERGFKKE